MPIGTQQESGVTSGVKFVTSTIGNTVGGVTNTVGGVVGALGRGIGETGLVLDNGSGLSRTARMTLCTPMTFAS